MRKILKKILPLCFSQTMFNDFKNAEEFYNAVGTCPTRLKINNSFFDQKLNELIKEKKFGKKKLSKRIQNKIFNFIMNIPSDYYRFLNPRKHF